MANRKREQPVVRVTVSLDAGDYNRLTQMAHISGVSLAWVLRRATKEFLSKSLESGAVEIVSARPTGDH